MEQQIKTDYESGDSTLVIAKRYNCSTSKITRILKKLGVKLRNASEAAKIALESGRSINPTKGKTHSEESKEKMSKNKEGYWATLSDEERQKIKDQAKTKWDQKSDAEKRQMQTKAGQALRLAGKKGSKAENYLVEALKNAGYIVEHHNKQLMAGEFEIDILLPELSVVIELDGPQHFLPVFGEDRLAKTKISDQTKNGVLIASGYKVIRVKYIATKFNKTVGRNMFEAVQKTLKGKLEKLNYVEF
jgi:very-short-patch-repair endonuclease